jgi:hypothetical protein
MSDSSDFYVGYLPQAPGSLGRWLRRLIPALLVGIAVLAVVLVTRQDRFGPGVFEFGVEREFTGVVLELPYPTLLPLNPADLAVTEHGPLLLVALGKHGPAELVRGMHGQAVRIEGTLIHRDGRAMVEAHSVAPLSIEAADRLVLPPGGVDRGEVTLIGEVVDSKCYLGVMKPGHTKPHRACAVRCISGGVPPLLLVIEADGSARQLLLASAQGEMIQTEVLPFVAERVEITGTVRVHGNLEVLYADPRTYRRVPPA